MSRDGAGRVQRHGAAVEAGDRSAIELPEEIGHVGGQQIDERRPGVERLLFGVGPALGHRLLDQVDVPLALRRDGAGVAGDVRGHLLGHHLVDLLAVASHGMGGADVRPRRHRCDVSSHRDQKACGSRTRTRRPDEHHDRGLRGDESRC